VLLAGAAICAVAAAVVVMAVPGLNKQLKPLTSLFAGTSTDIITYHVKPANLPVVVTERGNLESSSNQDVFCKVEGSTVIIMILAEGSPVKKDQLVCELDSAALSDQLTSQMITTKGAEAAFQNAKLTREVGEIAVIEYVEGIFKQDLETVKGEIALAQADLKRAEDRLEWSDKMLKKGYVSLGQNISDNLTLQRAKFAVEQAQTKKDVLLTYTKHKTEKELQSEVKKSLSDELAKQSTWELEKSKEEKLRKQIANCKLVAPADGIVVYANDPGRMGGQQTPQIEEGAAVRERQKIFSLPDISKMQVNTKVHESMVDRITPGLRARIKVDAFADETLTGFVKEIAPLPDPSSFFSSDIKVYTTRVTVEKGLPGLKPGMTAQVEILITELENVLSIPVQAVLQYSNKDHIAVKTPDGFSWREVTLGISNDKLVEVKKGLMSGDVVALNPIALMSEEEKREAFGSSSKDATKKDWGQAVPKVGQVALPPGVDPAKAGVAGAPGAPGAPGKGGDPAKAKAKRGGGMNMSPALREKMKNIDFAKMKGASPEEREALLRQAGLTDAEIEQMAQARANRAAGGGGGGFGGPGGGGGGFGGPGGRGGAGGPGGGGGGFGGPGGGGQRP
jgi:HlyD family secretion protein